MREEIAEQPAALARLLAAHCPDPKGDVVLDGALEAALSRSPGILWAACGSSLQAAHLGAFALAELAALPSTVLPAHALAGLGRAPWRAAQLAILISQSGETEDTLEAQRLAQAHAVPTLCMVNVPNSAMARNSRWRMDTHAGVERAVPSTKGFVAQAASALLLAAAAARAQRAPQRPVHAMQAALHALPGQIEALLAAADTSPLAQLAEAIAHARQAIYLGRGADAPVACEGALKLMESAYVPAQGFAFGEFKHGPMAVLQADTPVIAQVSPGPLAARSRHNLEQILACGAPVWWLGPSGMAEMAGFAGTHWPLPASLPLVQPLLAAVALQLVAHRAAAQLKHNPDAPRHLVKSVQQL